MASVNVDVNPVPNEWRLYHNSRPVSLNSERKKNHWIRHDETKTWREAFAYLALQQKIPGYLWVEVEVRAVLPNASAHRMDLGNCLPSAKAAIDGLVDAGVIPDDNEMYLRRLTFLPALTIPGQRGLELVVLGFVKQARRWRPTRSR